MTDFLTPEKRSELMRKVKTQDTAPEMAVRKILYSLGYRYRLHDTRLPGKPDIVFKKWRKIIFVHGCFWHGHNGCKKSTLPKTARIFWKTKIQNNKKRDLRDITLLRQLGWDIFVVWECETRDLSTLTKRLVVFMKDQFEALL